MRHHPSSWIIKAGAAGWLLALLALAAGPAPAVQETYLDRTTLSASRVLPASLQKGAHFKVAEPVPNDGFLNRYTVDSDYGQFQVLSTPALRKLVGEIAAIARMVKIQKSKVFAQSLEDSARKTGRGIKKLFTDPAGAFQGAAEGMNRLFQRTGEVLSGPGPGQAEDSRAAQLIGFSKAKREIAARFGVDVYSANPVLQKHLDELAWADYAGGLSLGAATAMVPGGAGLVITTSSGARLLEDVIRSTPPPELRMQNRAKLKGAGLDPALIDLFIGSAVYSPREQTVVAEAVAGLKGVKGRENLLKTALQAHRRDMAFVLSNLVAMYAVYHRKVRPLAEFLPLARVCYARTREGAAVVALPSDYLLWSSRLAGALKLVETSAGGRPELWVTGSLSRRARAELIRRGWKVTTGVERIWLKSTGGSRGRKP